MLALRGDAAEIKRIRDAAGAVFGVFLAGTAVAQAADAPAWVRIAFAVIAVVGGLVAFVLLVLLHKAERGEERANLSEQVAAAERARAARLRTRVDHFANLSAYELGVDHEAVKLDELEGAEAARYLPRDRDEDLRAALDAAVETGQPRMIAVRGRSKVGKSRTLFQAVREHPRRRGLDGRSHRWRGARQVARAWRTARARARTAAHMAG